MPPSESELKAQISTTLLRVLNKVQADSRATRDFGSGVELSMVEAQIVLLISRGHCYGADLAALLGVTPSAVSQVVAKLKTKHLVTAEREPNNARRKALALTADGRATAARIRQYQELLTSSLLDVPTSGLKNYLRFVSDLEVFLDEHRMR